MGSSEISRLIGQFAERSNTSIYRGTVIRIASGVINLEAQEGSTLEATVTNIKLPDGTQSKALIINGKAVPVELPEGISEGDKIVLQVLEGGKSPLLKVLKVEGPQSNESSPKDLIVAKVLQALVEKLNLAGEELKALREVIRPLDTFPKLELPRSKTDIQRNEQPSLLIPDKTPPELPLLVDSDLDTSEKIETILQKSGTARSLDILKEITSEIERSREDTKTTKQEEAPLKILERNIREALKAVPQRNSEIPRVSAESAKEPLFESLEKSTRSGIARLVEVLKSLNAKASDAISISEAKIRVFLRDHLNSVASSTESTDTILKVTGPEFGLPALEDTLRRLKLETAKSPTPLSQKLGEFVQETLTELENAKSAKDPEPKVRDVLVRALEHIEREFKAAPSTEGATSQITTQEALPRRLQNLVRSVEDQIVTLLSSPEILPRSIAGSKSSESFDLKVQQLVQFLRSIEKSESEPKTEQEKVFQATIREIRDSLEGNRNTPKSDAEVRRDLVKALETLNDRFGDPAIKSRTQDLLPKRQELLVKDVAEQIRQILTQQKAAIPEDLFLNLQNLQSTLSMDPASNKPTMELISALMKKLVENSDSSESIREILKAALESLGENGVEAPFAELLKGKIRERSSYEVLVAMAERLGAIDLELIATAEGSKASVIPVRLETTLLSILERIQVGSNNSPERELSPQFLKDIIPSLKDLLKELKTAGSAPQEVQNQTNDLIKLLEVASQDPSSREIMNQVKRPLLQLLEKLYAEQIQSPLETEISNILEPHGKEIATQTTPLSEIRNALRDLFERIGSSLKAVPFEELAARLANSNSMAEFRALLLRSDVSTMGLSETRQAEAQEIINLLKQATVDRDEKAFRSNTDPAKRLHDLARDHLVQTGKHEKDLGTKAVSQEIRSLKILENMIQGQEVLRQMNPIMQAMGEPIMLLFPSLLQGLLSKFEVSILPDAFVEGEEKKKKGGANTKGFHRLVINANLPELGRVSADIAHRDRQILMNILLENPKGRDFIEKRIGLLELSLRSLDYEEVSIHVASGEPRAAQPEWVRELTKYQGIVA